MFFICLLFVCLIAFYDKMTGLVEEGRVVDVVILITATTSGAAENSMKNDSHVALLLFSPLVEEGSLTLFTDWYPAVQKHYISSFFVLRNKTSFFIVRCSELRNGYNCGQSRHHICVCMLCLDLQKDSLIFNFKLKLLLQSSTCNSSNPEG